MSDSSQPESQPPTPPPQIVKLPHELLVKMHGIVSLLEQELTVASNMKAVVLSQDFHVDPKGYQNWLRRHADRLDTLATDTRGLAREVSQCEPIPVTLLGQRD